MLQYLHEEDVLGYPLSHLGDRPGLLLVCFSSFVLTFYKAAAWMQKLPEMWETKPSAAASDSSEDQILHAAMY